MPVTFVNSSKIPSSGVNASYAKRVTVVGLFSTSSDVEEVQAASDVTAKMNTHSRFIIFLQGKRVE